MPYSTLQGEGAKVFEKVYQKALGTYSGDKEKASRVAWSALKGAGYRKGADGQWTKKSEAIAEFSMAIVKASYDKRSGGAMRFRAVASDTEPDLYTEAMAPELFQDFVYRIENDVPIPEEFKSAICEDAWCGGMPYPSISHFRSGDKGSNVPGKIESVYVDGNRLKSTGVLFDTDLGRAVFKALLDDLYAQKSDADHVPVRISIGFLDLQHSHIGNGMNYKFERKNLTDTCPMCDEHVGGKVYQKGVLVHEAFTRVPVNPRTEAEVERSMTDAIVTKQDDAASIIGKDMAGLLVDKSKAEVLVIKSDGTVEKTHMGGYTQEPQLRGRNDGEGKTLKLADASAFNDCYDPNTGMYNQECIDQAVMGHMPAMRRAMAAMNPATSGKADAGITGAAEVPSNDEAGKWLSLVQMFATTKKEPDGEHPASHYLYVGDSSKTSTWHLPVKDTSGKISPRHLGAAHAALGKGFRGQKYGGPGKGQALAKLRRLYHSAGMEWPEDSSNSKKEKSLMETKGNIQGAPVPGSPDMMDVLDGEDALYPEVPSKEESVDPKDTSGMGAPAGTVTEIKRAKAFAGKETPAEEAAEKKNPKMEKALVMSAKSLIQQVHTLKEQGVYGDMALQAIQPYMNQFGDAIRRSLTYQSGDNGEILAAMQALTQQVAVMRAQLEAAGVTPGVGAAQASVQRSQVPASRAITFNPATMAVMQQQSQAAGELGGLTTDKKPFGQIAALARKSVGL